MACLYDMSELGLPFTQSAFKAIQIEGDTEQHPLGLSDEVMKQERTMRFFNLLVCKSCRAEWMRTIADWFAKTPVGEDAGIEAGSVYVRDLGATREATLEEIARMQSGRK